ncbi:MAG: serine/threonine-protein kinase [Sandaracinaceae bacterium]
MIGSAAETPPAIEPGTVVAERYELVQEAARGGMGTVWKARHVALDGPVAVKFLDPRLFTPEHHRRFLREARAAARVNHRNVVRVLDFGYLGALPFLVMEWLEGEPLARRLDAEPPPTVRFLIDVVLETLDGLEACHEVGVIHRDLKPQNVFLAAVPGGAPRATIVDFGVSRRDTALAPDLDTCLTRTGQIVGTPMYMAPEQLRGPREGDPRCDVYSVGAVLYEALAGEPPFGATTLVGLIMAIASERPRPLREVRPALGDDLSSVIARAMAPEPAERFPTARAMADALRAALGPEHDRLPVGPTCGCGRARRAEMPTIDTPTVPWSAAAGEEATLFRPTPRGMPVEEGGDADAQGTGLLPRGPSGSAMTLASSADACPAASGTRPRPAARVHEGAVTRVDPPRDDEPPSGRDFDIGDEVRMTVRPALRRARPRGLRLWSAVGGVVLLATAVVLVALALR